ncbi:MAG: NifU family protein [Clostridia bacterium]|nr:NifU family protein [Clostridia bacterium]
MELKEYLDRKIIPLVRADGGWLELKEDNGESIVLTAKGECSVCRATDRCAAWVRNRVMTDLGRDVKITVERDPFLWRK